MLMAVVSHAILVDKVNVIRAATAIRMPQNYGLPPRVSSAPLTSIKYSIKTDVSCPRVLPDTLEQKLGLQGDEYCRMVYRIFVDSKKRARLCWI